jgi:hypothetical protein
MGISLNKKSKQKNNERVLQLELYKQTIFGKMLNIFDSIGADFL